MIVRNVKTDERFWADGKYRGRLGTRETVPCYPGSDRPVGKGCHFIDFGGGVTGYVCTRGKALKEIPPRRFIGYYLEEVTDEKASEVGG